MGNFWVREGFVGKTYDIRILALDLCLANGGGTGVCESEKVSGFLVYMNFEPARHLKRTPK